MRIKTLHPANGWRACYPREGGVRIAQIVFFAIVEDHLPGKERIVPLVPDDHDYAQELVPAERLGHYALLGPDEEADQAWLKELAKG
jgi:hypothetical protein